MSYRQSRPRRDRRKIDPNLPSLLAQPFAAHASLFGAGDQILISLGVSPFPPDGSYEIPTVRLVGLPKIVNTSNLEMPIAAELDVTNGELKLTYPSVMAPGEILFIGPNDPAVRTVGGGYLSVGYVREGT